MLSIFCPLQIAAFELHALTTSQDFICWRLLGITSIIMNLLNFQNVVYRNSKREQGYLVAVMLVKVCTHGSQCFGTYPKEDHSVVALWLRKSLLLQLYTV